METLKRKILLLEDDSNLGTIVQEHLTLNGYDVTLCGDGQAGASIYRPGRFDLCLVDVMMPKKDGFTFVRELRRTDDQVPVIFLTAKALKEDRITGFKIGCDDYIIKPFSIEELLLRIHAVLKRTSSSPPDTEETKFQIGHYSFDSRRRVLRRGDKEKKLTGRESELLRLLCHYLNRTLPREVALREIWGDDGYFAGRSMDVFVTKLRKYLQDDGRVTILSVHGKGLMLTVSD
ncbi:MAG: response regulator transcription factor [Candidatus Zixiibacteriota bacterium]|nr:MAG: response regulator transcription factor [candidate division Zixibacteria bacterium]